MIFTRYTNITFCYKYQYAIEEEGLGVQMPSVK